MDEFSAELRIPKDRIAVLIGTKGEIKSRLEKVSSTRINIDSKEGEITIVGKDSLWIFTVKEVIRAIGRGFNPETALQLLKQDFSFELLNIPDYVKSKNGLIRLKGRVIGAEGKSRKHIELLTETNICVYGKTIGIIGRHENVSIARRAVDSLLLGSPHSSVYKWLERKRRELKMREFNAAEDII